MEPEVQQGRPMRSASVHLSLRLRRQLAKRARISGKSVSEEMRNAVDFYLQLPFREEKELRTLLRLASRSADRSIRKLDETIYYVKRALKRQANARRRCVSFNAN